MALFADSSTERTERPTARRRRQARERGLVARSSELLSAARLLAIWAVLAWWLGVFVDTSAHWVHDGFQPIELTRLRSQTLLPRVREFAGHFFATAGTPLLIATGAIVIAHFAQVGWLWRWNNLAPQAARLSPFSNTSRWQPVAVCGRAILMILKLTLVTTACVVALSHVPSPPQPSSLTGLAEFTRTWSSPALRLASSVALSLLVFGAVDYMWQRHRLERSLRMTTAELRQELKEIEGDPQVKHQRQAAAQQLVSSLTTSFHQ